MRTIITAVICSICLLTMALPVTAGDYTVEQCVEYVNSFLLESDYTNAMAWVEYGLKDYPGDLKLEVARFKVLVSDKDRANDAAAKERLRKLMASKGRMDAEMLNILIEAGYFRPPLVLTRATNSRGEEYIPPRVSVDILAVGLYRIVPKPPEGADVSLTMPVSWQPVIWVRNNSDYSLKDALITVGGAGAIEEPPPSDDPRAVMSQDGRTGRAGVVDGGGQPQPRVAGGGSQGNVTVAPEGGENPDMGSVSPISEKFTVRPGETKKILFTTKLDYKGDKMTQPLQCVITWINDRNDRVHATLKAERIESVDVPVMEVRIMEK